MSSLALGAVKRLSVLADRARPVSPGLVVLIYHRVGRRTQSRVDLPEWLFEEQISRLVDGPGVVRLDRALELLRSEHAPSRQPVAVTFDDGTADFVDVALPILVRFGVPVTLYVATEFIEAGRPFPQGGIPASWSALRDAVTTGLVTIGSHTHSHALLDRLPPSEAASDLDRSTELIAERLQVKAEHFAYPKAVLGTVAVESEVKRRFRSAAVAGTRANKPGSTDPYRLARSPVQVEDGLRYFEEKIQGHMGLEDDLRRLANRRRLVGLTR